MSKERYEIKEKIGQGGVGAVYKALDTQLNREVAIKRVLAEEGQESDSDATKNLLKEATALSALQHPHIVTIYDAGVDDDGPYVVMEMINGRTLDEMVERGTLTWDDLYEVALQTQEALIAAQDLDLVHRDLKPSNVMVCWLASGKFQVKIVDFGLAKFSAAPSLQTIDHGDAVFGSIFFMAPEQFERTPLDQRTDMYAMGCLYYYALTGEYPFNGDTAAAVMASHLQHHITHLREARPDIPAWAADWVMWHMERNMADRPVNARQALEQLLVLEKQGEQTTPLSSTPPPSATKLNFGNTAPVAVAQAAAMAPTQPIQTAGEHNDTTTPVQIMAPGANAINPHTQAQNTVNQIQAVTTTQQVRVNPNTGAVPQVTAAVTTPAPPPSTITTPQDTTPSAQSKPSLKSIINDLPKAAKISIVTLTSLVILTTLIIYSSLSGGRKEAKAYNKAILEAKALDQQNTLREGLTVSSLELNALLNRAVSSEVTSNRTLLKKSIAYAQGDDFDADPVIVNFVTESNVADEAMRIDLLKFVVSNRKNPENIKTLLNFAQNTSNTESATAAINAARANLDITNNPDQHFINFLDIVNNSEKNEVINAAEKTAALIVTNSDNKEAFHKSVINSYESAIGDHNKYALLRLLGATGTEEAGKIIIKSLNSGNHAFESAAIMAIAQCPNDLLFEYLPKYINKANNEQLKKNAFDTAIKMYSKNPTPQKFRTLEAVTTSDHQILQMIPYLRSLNHSSWAKNYISGLTRHNNNRISKMAIQIEKEFFSKDNK